MTGYKLPFVFMIFWCAVIRVKTASIGHSADHRQEDWTQCHGIYCETRRQIQHGLSPQDESTTAGVTSDNGGLEEFILYSERQLNLLREWEENEQADKLDDRHVRKKRKLDSANLVELWELPIPYKFSGHHTDYERSEIERAMRHWSEHTCVRFEEIPQHQSYSDNHLLFTGESAGCFTYVGKTGAIPQKINLTPACFDQFGVLVHEIGHILGLWHEQQRWDRDEFISVNYNNLGPYSMQFRKLSTENLDVGYDMGSVMHYAPYDGTKNGYKVINSVNPLYQPNMGQRTGLSFNDAKIINFAYCSDVCSAALPQACEKGGYQDPNDCTKCKCPPGYGGVYCDELQSSNANCGGEISLNTTGFHYISSPNYPNGYTSFTSCNWKIKAPVNHLVKLKFNGDFKVFSQSQKQCFHWVEVKYKGLLDSQGPRFCGNFRPYYTLVSDHEEILVIFRSDFIVTDTSACKGFQLKMWAVPNPNAVIESSTVKLSTQSTSVWSTPSTTETITTATTTTTVLTQSTGTLSTVPSTKPSITSSTTSVPATESTHSTETVSPNCVKVDLSFLLDSSGSVGSHNWIKSKDFVVDIIQRLTISAGCSRVAVLSFGNFAYKYTSLSDYTEGKSAIIKTVQAMTFKDEWTNTADALRTIVEEVYVDTNGDREDVKDVSVLLTDGEGNVKPKTTIPNAENARDKGVTILGIGVGSKVNKPELNAIANNTDHVMFVNTFSDLLTDAFLSHIIQSITAIAVPSSATDVPLSSSTSATSSTTSTTETTTKPSTVSDSTTKSSTITESNTKSTTTTESTTSTATESSTTTEATTETSTTTKSSTTTESTTKSSTTTESTTESSTSTSSIASTTNQAHQTSSTTSTDNQPTPHDSTASDFECSFEVLPSGQSPSMCGITQSQDDQFDWTLQSGSTPSEPTGPQAAFDGNWYMFIEASTPRQAGDTAVLELPAVTTSRLYCITFNYHMFGFHINTLNVYIATADKSSRTKIWSLFGEQGDHWFEAEVTTNMNTGQKIQFEGIRGDEYSGDIALDNIHLKSC